MEFGTREDGELILVASQDIPSRTYIKGLEDLVLLVGDEEAIVAHGISQHYTEWIKVGKEEQVFVWCGPFRLARRGCSLCTNTKWNGRPANPGLPPNTLRQALITTKKIKKGEIISCNFGIQETRQW